MHSSERRPEGCLASRAPTRPRILVPSALLGGAPCRSRSVMWLSRSRLLLLALLLRMQQSRLPARAGPPTLRLNIETLPRQRLASKKRAFRVSHSAGDVMKWHHRG
ncbi:hypothetical protein FJTKL_03722 [Diaporthe vaccinii]|uniref:Uncharacterized protein n=1 Tax=Diaporthe vaccinii TaxID=105482 RepID=A0ABR4DUM3_9PEZI